MRNATLTILVAICILAAFADSESIMLLLVTKLVALITGATSYLLYAYWVEQGKINPIEED